MLKISNAAEMAIALSSPLDPALAHLLEQRRDQLLEHEGYDLGELAHFVVVAPGDTATATEQALGFDPCANFIDGLRYGEDGFEPSWEWIERHGDWYEAVFVLSDDGFGSVLLVPDESGVEPTLLSLCNHYGRKIA
ncbi:hypothetical protein E2E30_00465 [Sphingomonas sp. AAP5]|uniref:hypothetical protein n=1 Tax=Sphingomonas sp. AAP5 TaxID=1523415 RepID=UPI0010574FC9|nr:hypothetical protein [Sphingomonas sp. AAP5]QBM74388.1 hypothetical protein E2E30_00465 [Sphingomonas sp. AAP5]